MPDSPSIAWLWFQSAPPCGGRPRSPGLSRRPCRTVSIRAPVRGATRTVHLSSQSSCFNPRPRAGGDLSVWQPSSTTYCRGFNPRPRAGGDRNHVPLAVIVLELFQSAPPCGGRHGGVIIFADMAVSIRAPVRGATCNYLCNCIQLSVVSIRAPVRGATCNTKSIPNRQSECFNPRPRAGGDMVGQARRRRKRRVSIRAPVRGATIRSAMVPGNDLFQSAPPCGGRPAAAGWLLTLILCFNPRPRAGGDVSAASG